MRIKTPAFWYQPETVYARILMILLLPFSLIYAFGQKLHQLWPRKTYQSVLPVICVGNLVAGGSGKTPTAQALMKLIIELHLTKNPTFLTRGYGGSLKKACFVDRKAHSYTQTGDEPLLLSRQAPVIVSPSRLEGAMMAENHHKDFIIMDDGYQNQSLSKTLQFLVIDGVSGFGNGQLLPAGPLRESAHKGIERAHAVILIGEDQHNVRAQIPTDIPVFKAKLEVPTEWVAAKDTPYVGFTGLGRPQKFRKSLEENELNIAGWHEFPDHYPYTVTDLEKLDREASDKNARLITTEKDAMRLPADFKATVPLDIMPVKLMWDTPETVKNFLINNINKDN